MIILLLSPVPMSGKRQHNVAEKTQNLKSDVLVSSSNSSHVIWLRLAIQSIWAHFLLYKIKAGAEEKLCLPRISCQVIVCIKCSTSLCNAFNRLAQRCHNNERSKKAISWLVPVPVFAFLWLQQCTQHQHLWVLAADVPQLLLPQRDSLLSW